MFKIPRANVIESDEGFSVEVLGLTGLKYVQNGKILHIDSELSVPPHDMLIFAMNIKRWDSGQSINEDTKRIILDNILRAFAWKGMKPDIKYRNPVYTKRKPNIIESDEGFSVEILGQTQLKYIQNLRVVSIAYERSFHFLRQCTINIVENSITKWDTGEPIDDEIRNLIVFNIVGALMWDGYKVQSTYRKK